MPQVTRLDDKHTGHDSCAPMPLIAGSPNVFVNGKNAGRVTDIYSAHSCAAHSPHQGKIDSGSSTVFINGLSAGRVDDPIDCGGTVAEGSPNVSIGG